MLRGHQLSSNYRSHHNTWSATTLVLTSFSIEQSLTQIPHPLYIHPLSILAYLIWNLELSFRSFLIEFNNTLVTSKNSNSHNSRQLISTKFILSFLELINQHIKMLKTTPNISLPSNEPLPSHESSNNLCLSENFIENDSECFWCGRPSTVVCPKCEEAPYCSQECLEDYHLYQDKTTNKILRHAKSSKSSNNNEDTLAQSKNTDKTNAIQTNTPNGNHNSLDNIIKPNTICLPYKIIFTKEKGRVVVATRDIKPLELIMSDEPFIIGPSRQQQLVCVECLLPVDGKVRCPDCNFPLCKLDCPEKSSAQWHKSLECPYLMSVNYRASNSLTDKIKVDSCTLLTDIPFILVELAAITPLRLLLRGMKGDKCTREKFTNKPLYDFCSPVQDNVRICAFESDMLSVMWNGMKMKDCIDDIDTIRKSIGQLFNNAKSLEKQGHQSSGLYGRYAMINHACVSNAKVVVGRATSHFTIQVRAQVFIKKGEEITTRYVGITNGVPLRADMLREHWCFTCSCDRCVDPTELGSYFSAILCKKCMAFNEDDKDPKGLLLPNASSSSSGDNSTSTQLSGPVIAAAANEWKCNNCEHSITKELVEKIIDAGLLCIRTNINAGHALCNMFADIGNNTTIPPDAVILEEVVRDLCAIFHPQHYLIMQVKFVLLRVLSAKLTSQPKPTSKKPQLPENPKTVERSIPISDDESSSDTSRSSCSSLPSSCETPSSSSESQEEEEDKFPVKQYQRLIRLCNELLEVLNVLDPGASVNRGRVLKEMIGPVMKLSQHELDVGEIDEVEFKLRKMYCSKLAKDLVECYKYEFI